MSKELLAELGTIYTELKTIQETNPQAFVGVNATQKALLQKVKKLLSELPKEDQNDKQGKANNNDKKLSKEYGFTQSKDGNPPKALILNQGIETVLPEGISLIISSDLGTEYDTFMMYNGNMEQVFIDKKFVTKLDPSTLNLVSDIDDLDESERKKIVLCPKTRKTKGIEKYLTKLPTNIPNLHIEWRFSGVPEGFHEGLKNIALQASGFNLAAGDKFDAYSSFTAPLKLDAPEKIKATFKLSDDDAQKYGNKQWAFRFTALPIDALINKGQVNNVSHDSPAAKTPLALYILIEDLGDVVNVPPKLTTEEKKELQKKLDTNKIKFSNTLGNKEQDLVLSAMSMLPDKVLKNMRQLNFEVDDAKVGAGARAHYNSSDHKIRFKQSTLDDNVTHIGDDDNDEENNRFVNNAQSTALHEMGHAYDYSSVSTCLRNYNYFVRKWDTFKHDDEKMDQFNRLKEKIRKGVVLKSGGAALILKGDSPDLDSSDTKYNTEFKKRLKQDTPNHLTKYAETNLKEAFAECFSLYYSAPHLVEKLSPNIYDYFKNHLKI